MRNFESILEMTTRFEKMIETIDMTDQHKADLGASFIAGCTAMFYQITERGQVLTERQACEMLSYFKSEILVYRAVISQPKGQPN
jgi:hypothetical protein